MKREHLAFLLGGLAFGVLLGFGLFSAVQHQPALDGAAAPAASAPLGPQGPSAPTQVVNPAAGGGAPMVAEINRLKAQLAQRPDDVETVLRLADLHHQAGMWQPAAGYYERAVTLRPTDPNLLTDLGICYGEMGEFDRALEQFDRAHQVDPRHWQSLFNKAVVAGFRVQRLDEARSALAAIDSIAPPPPDIDPTRLAQLRQALAERGAAAGAAATGPAS